MTAWLSTLLAFALTVSAVTLCALVLTPMLRNRVSARSLYLAWLAVLVCALMMAALYGYARRGQWQAVACLLVMLAYGYMESQVTHLTSDPALLLLCGAVFALPRERWLDE